MREAVAFLLLACACGAATWSGRSADARRRTADEDAVAAPGSDPLRAGSAADGTHPHDPAFASLEARAAALAPGMRQAAERESGGERTELVRAAGNDTCVRVAFEATAPVLARLLDADGTLLCETRVPTRRGGARRAWSRVRAQERLGQRHRRRQRRPHPLNAGPAQAPCAWEDRQP